MHIQSGIHLLALLRAALQHLGLTMKDTADLARYPPPPPALPRLFQCLANCVPCNCYYIFNPYTPTFTTIASVGTKKEKKS